MSQPPTYNISNDFSDDETNNAGGRSTVKTAALDTELINLKATLDAVLANLALIQRDDTELADLTVKIHTIHSSVVALMGDVNPRGLWVTSTVYAIKDAVEESNVSYLCSEAHTSGVFATDHAAGKWIAMSGLTGAEIKTLYEGEADTNAFTDAEQTKLSGIETAATADQTGAEIKTAYEGETNTNAFTDAEQTKLSGIATGAEVNPAVVSRSEAEIGSATTERIWTAERVKQANVSTGYIQGDGFRLVNNVTDPDHDINILAGICRDSDDTDTIELTSTMVKQIDVDWAVGSGGGGFPSALTIADNTWYHVFVIKRSDTGVVDGGYDTSLTATNLLADATNYDAYRRVGSVLHGNLTTSVIDPFTQHGDDFMFDDGPRVILTGAHPTTRTLQSLPVPPDVVVKAHIGFHMIRGTNGATFAMLYNPALPDIVPSATRYTCQVNAFGGVNEESTHILDVLTNTSRQIAERADGTTSRELVLLGWEDFRGKK